MASSENCAAAGSAEDEFNSPDLLMSRSLTVSKNREAEQLLNVFHGKVGRMNYIDMNWASF